MCTCKNVRLAMYEEILRRTQSTNANFEVESVDEIAKEILDVSKCKWEKEIPIPIVAICRDMGFSIYKQELPEEICGYIAIDGELKEKFETDRIISVNVSESNKRRRFTVAHELGHFLFDFKPGNRIQYYNAFELNHTSEETNIEIPLEERRASRFAAELLMPKDEFKEAFRKANTEFPNDLYHVVQELSDKFLVPPRAVERRIKEELKLI